jgi:hypothetical protein
MDQRLARLARGERLDDDAPPGYGFRSASWSDAVTFLARMEAALTSPGHNLGPAEMRALVSQVEAMAPEMDGPMPREVVEFIQRHGPHAG